MTSTFDCEEAVLEAFGNRTDAASAGHNAIVIGSYVVYVITSLNVLIGITLLAWGKYFWKKGNNSRLKARNFVPVLACGVGIMAQTTQDTLREVIGIDTFLCSTSNVISFVSAAFVLAPIVIRLADFANRIAYLKKLRRYGRLLDAEEQRSEASSVGGDTRDSSSIVEHHNYAAIPFFSRLYVAFRHLTGSIRRETARLDEKAPKYDLMQEELVALRFICSESWRFIMFLNYMFQWSIVILITIFQSPYLRPSNGCRGCFLDPTYGVPGLIFGLAASIAFSSIMVYKLRKCEDSFEALAELRSAVIFGFPLLFIGVGFFTLGEGRFTFEGNFSFSWVTALGLNIIMYIHSTHQVLKAIQSSTKENFVLQQRNDDEQSSTTDVESNEKRKSRSKLKVLKEELKDQSFRDEFMKVLELEWCPELLRFYETANVWRAHFHERVDSTRRAHARKISKIYIDDDAAMQVNIDDNTRNRITEAVAKKSGELKLNLFDDAITETLRLMVDGPYARWLLTQKASNSDTAVSPISQ